MTVAAEDDPDSLDPALAYAPESWQVLVNAGEGLVAYRREPGPAGAEVVPALAAAMPAVSDGGRRLVFRLRHDARFGPPEDRPVRPSDVKASIERLFLAGSPGRGLYRGIRGARAFEAEREGGIAGIVARDASDEVEFRLTRSDPTFLRVLALPFAFVVPRGTPAADEGAAGPGLRRPLPRDRLRAGRRDRPRAQPRLRAGRGRRRRRARPDPRAAGDVVRGGRAPLRGRRRRLRDGPADAGGGAGRRRARPPRCAATGRAAPTTSS